MGKKHTTAADQEREVAEKVDYLSKLLSTLRKIDDCLERASGALEGQRFQSGRNADYVSAQVDKAIEFVIDAKLLATELLGDAQEAPESPERATG